MDSNQNYKPSNIVSIFLTKFDSKEGYKLVWYKSSDSEFNFTGLDYKILPSSIQNLQQSNILISHYSQGKLYYGLGCFHQYILNQADNHHNQLETSISINRNDVKMYSLGILCDPKSKSGGSSSWKPNEFISNGWEYIDILDSTLLNYLHHEEENNFEIFDKLFNKLVVHSTLLFSNSTLTSNGNDSHPSASSSSSLIVPTINHHLLTKLPDLFQTLGPLIFIIYKQALLRKRILIFNQLHQQPLFDQNGQDEGDEEVANEVEEDDHNYVINSFNYLISLLSIIPQDINPISKSDKVNYYSQPIYNIGLNDLTRPKSIDGSEIENHLLDLNGIIASTNDDILLYQKNLYDIGVVINQNVEDNVWIFKYDDLNNGEGGNTNKRIRATLKDYQRFKLIYRELFNVNKTEDRQQNGNDESSEEQDPQVEIIPSSVHQERSLSTSSRLFPKNKIFTNLSNISTDDLNSVMTNNSTTSGPHPSTLNKSTIVNEDDDEEEEENGTDINVNIELLNYNDLKLDFEPEWWLKHGTEPISWRQSIWSAFSWFATAGQINDNEDNLHLHQGEINSNKKKHKSAIKEDHIDLMELIQIIGYFHKLTKKWFYLVDEIVMDQFEQLKNFNDTEESNTNTTTIIIDQQPTHNGYAENEDRALLNEDHSDKVTIELTYQDIVEMELDPYSENDLQFVREFVLLYWGSKVEKVEIGIGITSICC